ncbi:MAG: hypothetical protein K2N11_04795 [Mucispirillum sp.]|nr:hypothetical protein [Mucispirillum sp.]
MQSETRIVKYTVRFTKEENEIFKTNVNDALVSSKAEYLRKLALNQPILSKTDNENLRKLLKIAGEQGKYIGLLKIFIMEYELNEKNKEKILALINDIEQFRDKLKILSDKIFYRDCYDNKEISNEK